jgi:hypothetical protein
MATPDDDGIVPFGHRLSPQEPAENFFAIKNFCRIFCQR